MNCKSEVTAYPVSSFLMKHYDFGHFVPTYLEPFHIQGISEFRRSIRKMTKRSIKRYHIGSNDHIENRERVLL